MSITLIQILVILNLILTIALGFAVVFTYLSLTKIFKGTEGKSLKVVLERNLKLAVENQNKMSYLQQQIDLLKEQKKGFFQKSSFLRFNPFGDTGGDQSFIFSLLDEEDNGLVLSSLHGRNSTRVYGKKIVKGNIINHQLSKEESEVLQAAKKNRQVITEASIENATPHSKEPIGSARTAARSPEGM